MSGEESENDQFVGGNTRNSGNEFPYDLRPSTFQQRFDRDDFAFQKFSEEKETKDEGKHAISILAGQMNLLLERFGNLESDVRDLKQDLVATKNVPSSNAEVVRTRSTATRSSSNSDLKFFVERMSLASENAQFAQISGSLSNLTGREGRSKILSYFRQLESSTLGWTSRRKANLLAVHLVGQARNVFEGLSEDSQENYETIKEALLDNNCSFSSLRITAQNEFMAGVRPRLNESVMNYGQRVLQVTRDAATPGTPETTIEDWAVAHFLKYLGDPLINNALALARGKLSFHELLDQAVALREVHNASGFRNVAEIFRRPGNNWTSTATRGPPSTNYSPGRMISSPPNGAPFRGSQAQRPESRTGGNAQPLNRSSPVPFNRSGQRPQANRIEAGGDREFGVSLDGMVGQIEGNAGPETGNFSRCSVVTGVNLVTEGIKLIPITDTDRNGIALLSSEESRPPIHIAKPKGPTMVINVDICNVKVEALVDPGSEISLISQRCLGSIAKTAKIDLRKSNIHQPLFPNCSTANKSQLKCFAGISMPIIRNSEEIWVEMQVPEQPLPFPIILGTNCLTDLGFSLIDSTSGKDLLTAATGKFKSAQSFRVAVEEVSLASKTVIPPYSEIPVQAIAHTFPDGEYLFKSPNHVEDLVAVKNGQVTLAAINHGILTEDLAEGDVMGCLEPIDEVVTKEQIMSSTVVNELVSLKTRTAVVQFDKLRESLAFSTCELLHGERDKVLDFVVDKCLEWEPDDIPASWNLTISEEITKHECIRRGELCKVVATTLKQSGRVPIRFVGSVFGREFGELSDDVVTMSRDWFGSAWEATRFRLLRMTSRNFVSAATVVICPAHYRGDYELQAGVQVLTHADCDAFKKITDDAWFSGSVQRALVHLPDSKEETAQIIVDALSKMARWKHVEFTVVPPLPSLSEDYAKVVDFLLKGSGNNLHGNSSFRGRNILSIGWTGQSPSSFQMKDGRWTKAGLSMVLKFLGECCGWSSFWRARDTRGANVGGINRQGTQRMAPEGQGSVRFRVRIPGRGHVADLSRERLDPVRILRRSPPRVASHIAIPTPRRSPARGRVVARSRSPITAASADKPGPSHRYRR